MICRYRHVASIIPLYELSGYTFVFTTSVSWLWRQGETRQGEARQDRDRVRKSRVRPCDLGYTREEEESKSMIWSRIGTQGKRQVVA